MSPVVMAMDCWVVKFYLSTKRTPQTTKTPLRPDDPENHLSNHPKTKTADRAETHTTPKTNHNFQAEIKVLRQVPPDR